MTPPASAAAFAPAGVGNVGVGFDVLGHVIDAIGDVVRVRRVDRPGVRIVEVAGCEAQLPTEPERNTATAGLGALLRDAGAGFGLEVRIEKGIPLGSGMGGSAASAVAGVVAANQLLPEPFERAALLRYALIGEAVASGAAHADNLAPALLGGLVLARASDPPDLVRIPVPARLRCVLAHPRLRLDTREARAVLPHEVPLHTAIEQSAALAGVIAGCYAGDLALVGRSLRDHLVEPHRARLVPGFHAVQRAAMQAGALGCTLSGAGPSMFAWCDGEPAAERVRAAMLAAWSKAGVQARAWVSAVDAPGARVVEETRGKKE